MVRKKRNLIEDEKEVVKLNPRKLISYFYNKINVKTAAYVILVSLLFQLIIYAIIGVPNLGRFFVVNLIYTYLITWFVVGGILYLLAYFIRGKDKLEKNEFSKILAALSAFKVIYIFILLTFFAIVLVFVPKLLGYVRNVFASGVALNASSVLPALNGWNNLGLIILVIFAIAAAVYYLFAIYYLVKEIYKYKSFWVNLIILIVVLVILALLSKII